MKLIVGKEDRTETLGSEIRRLAHTRHRRHKPDWIEPEFSALSLTEADSEHDYLHKMMRLLRYRDGVLSMPFYIPRRAGLRGLISKLIKIFLWKLLRYQHDRIGFQQNLINSMFTNMLECEIAEREKEITCLKERLSDLESHIQKTESVQSDS